MSKRLFDILFSIAALFLLFIPMALIALAIKAKSEGPVLHWSKRIGQHNRMFFMPKFRSMIANTPQVPTHLLINPDQYLTTTGKLLRKFSLDELPQLFLVLKGEMSIVGPRPALFNEDKLIQLRHKKSIDSLKPGITGWAQINGRDKLHVREKVKLDEYYLKNKSFLLDLKIIILTSLKVLRTDEIAH